MKRKILAILNLVAYIVTIGINWLANSLPIGGVNTGEVSDYYPNLFAPAGVTFAIWGLIYILLLFFSTYQLIIAFKGDREDKEVVDKIGILFIISCIANITWIFAWHNIKILLSLVIILIILVSLIGIYENLNIGKSKCSKKIKYMVHMPFSIYLGWICIATIANVTTWLVSIKWSGWGISSEIWTIAVIIVGILLGLIYIFKKDDIFFGLVIDWSLLGIYIKRTFDAMPIKSIVFATIIGMILISASVAYKVLKKEVY